MPGVTRTVDTTGAAGHTPSVPTSNSGNVKANGSFVIRQGDTWSTHVLGIIVHPSPVSVGCSGTVIVNGVGVVRIGDSLSCGAVVASGSSNVIAGG
jgi:uncharacterized Zn-binding protein involved in type VI secretion